MYSSSSLSKSRPRLISISEAYRNLAQLISQRDVPLKLSLNKDREVVSIPYSRYYKTLSNIRPSWIEDEPKGLKNELQDTFDYKTQLRNCLG